MVVVAKVCYFTDILLSSVTAPATLGRLLFFACVCSRLAVVRCIATLFWISDSCATLLPERHLFRLCLFTPRGCPAYRDSLLDSGFLCCAVAGAAPRPPVVLLLSGRAGGAVVWALRARWVPATTVAASTVAGRSAVRGLDSIDSRRFG